MSREVERPKTRSLLGVLVVAIVGSMLLVGELATDVDVESDTGILVSIGLVTLIGGFLLAKRPNHRVSWLLVGCALFGGIAGMAADALPIGTTEITGWQIPLALLSGPSWFGLLAFILVLIPLYFPTGSPPTPRWRWVAWVTVGAWALISLLWTVQERYCTEWNDDECLASADNPIGITGVANPEETLIGGLVYGLLLLCSIAALASLVLRYRRSRTVERQQIKWVLLSLSLFVVGTVVFDVVWIELLGQPELVDPVWIWVDQVMWLVIPASVALAILRYRLYDIDRIISRTVGYALVIGLLAGVALGLVALLAVFLPSDDPLVVAIATLSAAALFHPLRRWVQTLVDRRFNRTRYVSERVIDDFAGSLRNRIDPEGVLEGWVGVVEETMQPATVGVWVRDGASAPSRETVRIG